MKVLTFNAVPKNNPTTSALFIWGVLSSFKNTRWFKLYDFRGIGLEPFDIERRISKESPPKPMGVEITTIENRVSLKHLIAVVIKLDESKTISFANTSSEKIRRTF